MLGIFIGLFTFVMILNCVVLVFLVLIQLPKKDAGAGLAFGASGADALFGAGSGTVLTKITKYSAGIFFALAILLSVMRTAYQHHRGSAFESQLGKPPVQSISPSAPATPQNPASSATNPPLQIPGLTNLPPGTAATNAPTATNAPAAEATNVPAAPSNAAPKQ